MWKRELYCFPRFSIPVVPVTGQVCQEGSRGQGQKAWRQIWGVSGIHNVVPKSKLGQLRAHGNYRVLAVSYCSIQYVCHSTVRFHKNHKNKRINHHTNRWSIVAHCSHVCLRSIIMHEPHGNSGCHSLCML